MSLNWIVNLYCVLSFATITLLLSLNEKADALVIAYDRFNGSEQFQDMESSFGPGVPEDGMLGVLVGAVPSDACQSILPPPFDPNELGIKNVTLTSFVLITRGGCDFGIKVLNAQKAGFVGAIVHNIGSDSLLRMSTSITDEIKIPSIFISYTSGRILNSSYLYNLGGHPYIQLYEGSFNPLEYYLIPFIIVIAVCFVSLLCFMIIKCIRDRRRTRRGRLSVQRLKKLPVKKYDKGDEYDVCAICLDEYEEGESLRILPCAHAYHCKCVDPWLTSSKRVCPLCKRRVLSDDESSSSSDEEASSDDERTPLVQASTASSPNAARFATGFPRSNPLTRNRTRNASADSTDSGDTSSTEISEVNVRPERRREISSKRSSPPNVQNEEMAHSSGYQPQDLLTVQGDTEGVSNQAFEPDDLLNLAELHIASKNRVSESSITILSDVDSRSSTPLANSYSSQEDYLSLGDEHICMTAEHQPTPERHSDDDTGSDNEHDIIVIATGSDHPIHPEV